MSDCEYCVRGRCTWLCANPEARVREQEKECGEAIDKASQKCYTITTGMTLRDFKDGIGQAYWNRDRETLERLLESLTES